MVRTLLLILIGLPLVLDGCSYDYSKLAARGADVDSGRAGASGTGGDIGSGGSVATESGGSSGSGGSVEASGGQTTLGTGGVGSGGVGSGGVTGGTGGGGGGMNVAGTTGTAGQDGVGGGASGGAAGADVTPRILSVDFVGGYTVNSTAGASGGGGAGGAGGSTTVTTVVSLPAMAVTEVAGVKPASHWNSAAGAVGMLTALSLADGTATTTSVMWNSPKNGSSPGIWRIGYADAAGDVRMMNGYLDPLTTAMPATVTVSDLPSSIVAAGYDVYVYVTGAVSSGTRTYKYSIGTITSTVSQVSPSGTTFSGFMLAPEAGAGNYIVFRNVIGPSFTLTATPGAGSQTRAPVNGIQIVSPAEL